MGKKTAVFTENQFVFAKVKGYSPWPAKITKVIAKHKYGVYFYGTGERANIKSEDLEVYDEKNRAKFNTERQLKKPDYKDAVDQIEQALLGNDPAPALLPENPQKEEEVVDKSVDIAMSETDPDESRLQIAEDAPKSTPVQSKKRPVAVKKSPVTPILPPPQAVQQPLESESKENDEKVSRSGRKIKEKKMNTDEIDPDDVFSHPRKRLKTEDSQQKQQAPASLNEAAIDAFVRTKGYILNDPDRKQFIMAQLEMMQLIQDVKTNLQLQQQDLDVDASLESLKKLHEIIAPCVEKIMLLKYPNVMSVIRRCKNYVGNYTLWNLDSDQLAEFQKKAAQIREVSDMIFQKFKKLFEDYPDRTSFWDYFNEEVAKFNEKYKDMDPNDLFEAYTFEELDEYVNNKLKNNDDAHVPQLPSDIAQNEVVD